MTNEGMRNLLPEEQRAAPIISAVKSVSEQTGRSMAQVALAWLRHQPVPVIPIIGARKVSQIQDNLASLDLELSAEQLKSVDGASRIDLGFPQSIYERETVRAVRYGGIWDSLLLECSIPLLASGNIKLQSPLYLALVKKCDRTSTFVIFLVEESSRQNFGNRAVWEVYERRTAGRAGN